MSPGFSVQTLCPLCNGGRTAERKLSVTRMEDGAKYHCFRASCSFAGFVTIGPSSGSGDYAPRPVDRPARPYAGGTVFSYKDAGTVLDLYSGFLGSTLTRDLGTWGISWSPREIVYQCRDTLGRILGYATRSPDKQIKMYRERQGIDLYATYFPLKDVTPRGTVLVEDPISAMACASHGFLGIALLGVNLPRDLEEYLSDRPFLVMLDPDAETQSLRLSNRFKYAKAIIGQRADPKDTPNLGELLRSYL